MNTADDNVVTWGLFRWVLGVLGVLVLISGSLTWSMDNAVADNTSNLTVHESVQHIQYDHILSRLTQIEEILIDINKRLRNEPQRHVFTWQLEKNDEENVDENSIDN